MKILKLLLFMFFFVLFFIPNACATDDFRSPSEGSIYNIGNFVIITGKVSLTEDIDGVKVHFYAYSDNLEETAEIATKYYNFKKDVPVTFAQINKGTLTWQISNDVKNSDDWVIKVELEKDTIQYKIVTSKEFTITRDLSVLFSTNQQIFNLGEKLEVSGTILDANENPITGDATITISSEVGIILSDTVEVENGYLFYEYNFKDSDPTGLYKLEVNMIDNNSNRGSAIIEDIELSDKLNMECTLQKQSFEPGDKVILVGTVKNIHNTPVEGLKVKTFVTDPEEEWTLTYEQVSDGNGKFAFEIQLPELSIPGIYYLRAETNDSSGNEGVCSKTFNVGSVKKLIAALSFNKSSYYKGELLDFVIEVENTGNLDINGTLELYIDNTTLIFSKEFEVKRGEIKSLRYTWQVKGSVGEHKIKAKIISDGEKLFETDEQDFLIYEKALPFKFKTKHAALLVIILIIIVIIYVKKQDIKEFFWHRELRKSFEKGRKPTQELI